MARITIHAGDWKGKATCTFSAIEMPMEQGQWLRGTVYRLTELETVDVASEEAVHKIGGSIGWGVAGAALLGPIGLIAGLLAGGRGKEVTFVAKFKDGKKMLATTDSGTFKKLMAAVF